MKIVNRINVRGGDVGVGANKAALTEVDPEAQLPSTAQASHMPLRAHAADQEHLFE